MFPPDDSYLAFFHLEVIRDQADQFPIGLSLVRGRHDLGPEDQFSFPAQLGLLCFRGDPDRDNHLLTIPEINPKPRVSGEEADGAEGNFQPGGSPALDFH